MKRKNDSGMWYWQAARRYIIELVMVTNAVTVWFVYFLKAIDKKNGTQIEKD